jgi:hypothetical protein
MDSWIVITKHLGPYSADMPKHYELLPPDYPIEVEEFVSLEAAKAKHPDKEPMSRANYIAFKAGIDHMNESYQLNHHPKTKGFFAKIFGKK